MPPPPRPTARGQSLWPQTTSPITTSPVPEPPGSLGAVLAQQAAQQAAFQRELLGALQRLKDEDKKEAAPPPDEKPPSELENMRLEEVVRRDGGQGGPVERPPKRTSRPLAEPEMGAALPGAETIPSLGQLPRGDEDSGEMCMPPSANGATPAAKAVYSDLFDWLVRAINLKAGGSAPRDVMGHSGG